MVAETLQWLHFGGNASEFPPLPPSSPVLTQYLLAHYFRYKIDSYISF